jgi:hypothetical protein
MSSNLSGKELMEEGDRVHNEFWQMYCTTGASTCEFGGIVGMLVELNTIIHDEKAYVPDDH